MPHADIINAQTEIMMKELAVLNVFVSKAELLGIVTKMAAVKDASPVQPALQGPIDGDLYEGIVTIDVTMSGTVKVRANSADEARELLCTAAQSNFPQSFEVDESLFRNFYLGDPDAVEKVEGN